MAPSASRSPPITRLSCEQKTESIDIGSKGSPPLKKVQFFLTLFNRPLTPPPLLFEHLSYFAGGVF